MNCNDYILLLSGHIDGLNSKKDEKTLESHLAVCPQCRQALEEMKANDTILKNESLTPPDRVLKNVMTQVRKDAKKKHRRMVNYIASFAAAAAVICLVLMTSLRTPLAPEERDMAGSLNEGEAIVLAQEPEGAQDSPIAAYASDSVVEGGSYVLSAPERQTRAGHVQSEDSYHCVFVELPSMYDVPTSLTTLPVEDFYSRIPREAQDYYYYGGSIVYTAALMSYDEMMQWEDKIQFRVLQEHIETDNYIVVFCSESR